MAAFTKRASTACVGCNERRVRCDALILGRPCTRCRQDHRYCKMRRKLDRSRDAASKSFGSIAAGSPAVAHVTSIHQGIQDISASTSLSEDNVSFSCYPFIDLEGCDTLEPVDIDFLHSKGCLEIPAPSLLEDFVRQYFLHIQPCTPIVDEAAFWKIYSQQESPNGATAKLSLLLIRSLLFASSPYVSLETVQKCGFQDKREAWNKLFQRAKILFHFHNGQGPLVRAQSALLLTLHTALNEPQAASLWLSHSIHSATQVTLHVADEKNDGGDSIAHSTISRLWWSILLRDRSLCLGLRRRPQVLSFELSMMRDLPDEESFQNEILTSEVYDPDTKRLLFGIFQEQCQLAILLTEAVSIIFGTHGLSTPLLSSAKFYETLTALHTTKTALQVWKEGATTFHSASFGANQATNKFLQLTMLYYHTARVDIAHFETLLIEKHREYAGTHYGKQISFAGNTLLDATTKLVGVLEYFSENGKVEDLPLSIVAYLATPLVLSALNLKLSSTDQEITTRRTPVESLGELMRHSQRVYEISDFISSSTDEILNLVYLTSRQIFQISNPSRGLSVELGRRRITNWHDAFLQHPRAYLLIVTTMDYFMSVGKLPDNNCLPELVYSMPLMGRIRLPWSSEPPRLREYSYSQRLRLPSSGSRKESVVEEETGTESDLRRERIETAKPDQSGRPSEPRVVNIDFLDLNSLVNIIPPPIERSYLAFKPLPGVDTDVSMESSEDGVGFHHVSQLSLSYDDYISELVQDCFGPA